MINMVNVEWILFISQLPTSPSSLRVTVWRRMRAAGAINLQNSVWVLPNSQKNEQFVNELLSFVKSQEGNATIFIARAVSPEDEDSIIKNFRVSVDQEYTEFVERCQDFLAEIERETGQKKFTFAELDENEEESQKLISWLRKIRARDNFGGAQAQEANIAIEKCAQALKAFTRCVYENEGLEAPENE